MVKASLASLIMLFSVGKGKISRSNWFWRVGGLDAIFYSCTVHEFWTGDSDTEVLYQLQLGWAMMVLITSVSSISSS
jgi:hypothetical protein